MSRPDEELEADASVDEAVERMEEHVSERDANERQGRIEERTREEHMDEG